MHILHPDDDDDDDDDMMVIVMMMMMMMMITMMVIVTIMTIMISYRDQMIVRFTIPWYFYLFRNRSLEGDGLKITEDLRDCSLIIDRYVTLE